MVVLTALSVAAANPHIQLRMLMAATCGSKKGKEMCCGVTVYAMGKLILRFVRRFAFSTGRTGTWSACRQIYSKRQRQRA